MHLSKRTFAALFSGFASLAILVVALAFAFGQGHPVFAGGSVPATYTPPAATATTIPTVIPTTAPTVVPTVVPTVAPTVLPTVAPTVAPTATVVPSGAVPAPCNPFDPNCTAGPVPEWVLCLLLLLLLLLIILLVLAVTRRRNPNQPTSNPPPTNPPPSANPSNPPPPTGQVPPS